MATSYENNKITNQGFPLLLPPPSYVGQHSGTLATYESMFSYTGSPNAALGLGGVTGIMLERQPIYFRPVAGSWCCWGAVQTLDNKMINVVLSYGGSRDILLDAPQNEKSLLFAIRTN